MKRKILLMRHAKSSWDHEGLKDFDRPLNKRGEKDAPKMGRFLREGLILPELIISSPARRAKETALAVCSQLGYDANRIQWNEDLYFGGPMDYLNAIHKAGDNFFTVMTVGHNPMTADLMAVLGGRAFSHRVPTAAIACFESDADSWSDVQSKSCRLLWVTSPREI